MHSAEFHNDNLLLWSSASRRCLERAAVESRPFETLEGLSDLFLGIVALHQTLHAARRLERLDPRAAADCPISRRGLDTAEGRARHIRNLVLHLNEHGTDNPVPLPGRVGESSNLFIGFSGGHIISAWGSLSVVEWTLWLDQLEPWARAHTEGRIQDALNTLDVGLIVDGAEDGPEPRPSNAGER